MPDVSLFIAINEDDDYEVSTDSDEAVERLTDNYGARAVKVYQINIGCLPSPSLEPVEINIEATHEIIGGETVTVKIG